MASNARIGFVLLSCLIFSGGALADMPMNAVRAIATAPNDQSLAAALIEREIWITKDDGKTWFRSARLPLVGLTEQESRAEAVFEASGETIKFQDESDEYEEPERERRIEWETTLDDVASAGDGEESVGDRSTPQIAVSDTGVWAAALDGNLFVGGPAPGVSGRFDLPGIVGVAFDRRGFLWVVAADTLILFDGVTGFRGGRRRWKLGGAGVPCLGLNGILVPGREGIWTASIDEKRVTPVLSLHSMSGVDAVASHPSRPEIFVVSLGRLKMYTPRGTLKDLGRAPSGIERIVVDAGGAIMVFSKRLGWLEKKGDSWRSVQVVSLVVDASGRLWRGAEHGPEGPGEKKRALDLTKPAVREFAGLLGESILNLEQSVGPPPCHTCTFGILPSARLFFGWATGGSTHEETDFMENRVGIDQWVYLGVQLTWRFGSIKTAACVASRRRWISLREQRRRKVEALWRELVKVHYSKPLEEDPFEEAILILEEKKLEEIIHIQTKTY